MTEGGQVTEVDENVKGGRWNRLRSKLLPNRQLSEESVTQTRDDGLSDFFVPRPTSAENKQSLVPKLDTAFASKWPQMTEVMSLQNKGGPEDLSPFHYHKPRRREGLQVGFSGAKPEYIGVGGDESEEPVLAVAHRRPARITTKNSVPTESPAPAPPTHGIPVVGSYSGRVMPDSTSQVRDMPGRGRTWSHERAPGMSAPHKVGPDTFSSGGYEPHVVDSRPPVSYPRRPSEHVKDSRPPSKLDTNIRTTNSTTKTPTLSIARSEEASEAPRRDSFQTISRMRAEEGKAFLAAGDRSFALRPGSFDSESGRSRSNSGEHRISRKRVGSGTSPNQRDASPWIDSRPSTGSSGDAGVSQVPQYPLSLSSAARQASPRGQPVTDWGREVFRPSSEDETYSTKGPTPAGFASIAGQTNNGQDLTASLQTSHSSSAQSPPTSQSSQSKYGLLQKPATTTTSSHISNDLATRDDDLNNRQDQAYVDRRSPPATLQPAESTSQPSKSRSLSPYTVFAEDDFRDNDRPMIHDNGGARRPTLDKTCIFKSNLDSFGMTTAQNVTDDQVLMHLPQWRRLQVFETYPQAIQATPQNPGLSILVFDSQTSYSDSVLRPQRFRLDTRRPYVLQALCEASPLRKLRVRSDRTQDQLTRTLQEASEVVKSQETLQTYEFATLEDLHDFQKAVTGRTVKYDGTAHLKVPKSKTILSTLSTHKNEHAAARIQVMSKGGHTRLAAFLDDGRALNFDLKEWDVFEATDIKGDLPAVKLVDTKFTFAGDDSTRDGRAYLPLSPEQHPDHDEDVTVGFDDEDGRAAFAASLPAEVKEHKGFTFKRRI